MHETQLVDEWSLRTVLSTADLFSIFCHFSACFIVLPPCLANPWPYSCLISINIHAKYQYKILPFKYIFKRLKITDFCEAQARVRQGSARDGSQGERPQSLNPCLELTLKLVATHHHHHPPTQSLILLRA